MSTAISGERNGHFDTGGSELRVLPREGDGIDKLDLLGRVGETASAGLGALDTTRFRPSSAAALDGLGRSLDVFAPALGAHGLVSGIRDGHGRTFVEGVGDVAGGLNSVAAVTAGLASGTRFSGAAVRFSSLAESKVLGGLGGAISLGFGLGDLLTADNRYERAAGGLAAASGALAIGSLFLGPSGWVVGGVLSGALGIASVFVGGGDDNQTAHEDRLSLT